MYTNEQGIKVYELGDVVQVGKGKARWTVDFVGVGGTAVHLKSESGREMVSVIERLTLIENVRTTTVFEGWNEDLCEHGLKAGDCDGRGRESDQDWDDMVSELKGEHGPELEVPEGKGRVVEVAAETPMTSSYGRAILFALQKLPTVFQGVGTKESRARRRAKNKVTRASRKANRR